MVLLDEGMACINGEWLPLTYEAHLAITEAVLNAYEVAINAKLRDLRIYFGLHQTSGQDPLRLSNEETAMVFGMPGTSTPVESAEPRQATASNMQSLSESASQKDAVRTMSRRKERGRASAPETRPAVPHSSPGDEA